jgi:hypothetical protein
MAKRLVLLILALMIPFFIGGCPSVEPDLAEPPKAGTVEFEPPEAEPNHVEPELPEAEPNHVEPELPEAEPNEITPALPEPNDVVVGVVEPNEPELPEAEPNEVSTVEPEPNDVVVGVVEPNEPEPTQVEPNEVTPVVPEANDVVVGVIEPSEPDPTQVEPNEVTPVVPEPNEVESTSVEPNDLETAVEPNAPKPDPATVFHTKCAGMLKDFVDDRGMVDYKALRGKRFELRALLQQFNRLDRNEYNSWSEEDRIAFWINVYNLQKLKVITDNYPIKPSSRWLTILYGGTSSIRHIEGKITSHKFLVMDEEWTFAAIEKRFLRGEFDDPRILFAMSDACLSSPPLRNEPYYGHKLDEQLRDQTKKFLSGPRAFSIDREKQKVYLSARFQLSWHGKEFIKKFAIDRKFKDQPPETRAVLNFISNYLSKQAVSFLEVGNYTISYMKYDWTINDRS